uniref:Uncharacterized protein n=1 Tax=Steinernema glaseri TaxID=37863 RepID=A0A1I7ZFF6_9BILA
MDSVPYDFVVSLMRVKLSNWHGILKDCELLGANYGTVASEMAKRLLWCTVDIPGILSRSPLSDQEAFSSAPRLWKGESREIVEVSSLSEADNLHYFSVYAEELIIDASDLEDKELSLRRFRSLMHTFRFAAFRELVFEDFQPDPLNRNFDRYFLAPSLTSFFNRVVLQYQEDASFKKLLLMFVDGMKIEFFSLKNSRATYDKRFVAPEWLQEALAILFFQPQFSNLELLEWSGWTNGFVDRLVSRWLKSPETVPKRSKSIDFTYRYVFLKPDLLSRYAFRRIRRQNREYGRIHPASTRRFDRAHPTEVKRRLIAKVYAGNGKESDLDIDFCRKATNMHLKFAFNEGEKAHYLKGLKGSFLTMKWKGRTYICGVLLLFLAYLFVLPLLFLYFVFLVHILFDAFCNAMFR